MLGTLCRGVSKLEFAAGGAVDAMYASPGAWALPLLPGRKASVPARVVPWVAARRLPPGAPMPADGGDGYQLVFR